jgi:hypothetical protein
MSWFPVGGILFYYIHEHLAASVKIHQIRRRNPLQAQTIQGSLDDRCSLGNLESPESPVFLAALKNVG